MSGKGKLWGPGFMRIVIWSFDSPSLNGECLFQTVDDAREWIKIGPLRAIGEWSHGDLALQDNQGRDFFVEKTGE